MCYLETWEWCLPDFDQMFRIIFGSNGNIFRYDNTFTTDNHNINPQMHWTVTDARSDVSKIMFEILSGKQWSNISYLIIYFCRRITKIKGVCRIIEYEIVLVKHVLLFLFGRACMVNSYAYMENMFIKRPYANGVKFTFNHFFFYWWRFSYCIFKSGWYWL